MEFLSWERFWNFLTGYSSNCKILQTSKFAENKNSEEEELCQLGQITSFLLFLYYNYMMDCDRENKKSFLKCHFKIKEQKCFALRTLLFVGIPTLLFSCNSTCLYIHLLSQSFLFQMNHVFQRKIILFLIPTVLWITFPGFSTKFSIIFAFENLTFDFDL